MTNQNAGVQVAISTLFNPSSGSTFITAVQSADLLAGLWYINIHTTVNPGGEIRGQVIGRKDNVVPIPTTLALFGLGLAGLGWSTRKKT